MVSCASVGEKRNSTEFQTEELEGSEMKRPRMGENVDDEPELKENQSVKNKSAMEDLKTKIRKYLEENRYTTLVRSHYLSLKHLLKACI